jgi:RNA polymerase-associated protein RTF1
MEMPEVQREDILTERREHFQRIQDKRNLDQMLKDQRDQINRAAEVGNVAKAAKRLYLLSSYDSIF